MVLQLFVSLASHWNCFGNQLKNFTSATKSLFLICLISVKSLWSKKFMLFLTTFWYFFFRFEFDLSVFQLFPIFEFKKILTSVYRITVNNYGMGGDIFIGHL